MAWGRKKSGGRKEPLFGLPAALADLRLTPADRIPDAADDEKPKKSVPKRKPEADDDEPPRERKPRGTKSGAKRRGKSRGRFRFGRLVYWGAVLGLWAAIAIVGVVVWVGAHLPAIPWDGRHSITGQTKGAATCQNFSRGYCISH